MEPTEQMFSHWTKRNLGSTIIVKNQSSDRILAVLKDSISPGYSGHYVVLSKRTPLETTHKGYLVFQESPMELYTTSKAEAERAFYE